MAMEHEISPILLVIYNRVELVARQIEQLRLVRPRKLYLFADGPKDNFEDRRLCELARRAIAQIDWPCELYTHFQDTNLGCAVSVPSAIDWVFQTEEEAIILEDDCMAEPSFFTWASQMLRHHSNQEQIAMVSGNCFLTRTDLSTETPFLTTRAMTWGWGTWKRSWIQHQKAMNPGDIFQFKQAKRGSFSPIELEYWQEIFSKCLNKDCSAWDYQWQFTMFIKNWYSISPNKNLVSNVGFGAQATHTKQIKWYANLPTAGIQISNATKVVDSSAAYDQQLSMKVHLYHPLKRIRLCVKTSWKAILLGVKNRFIIQPEEPFSERASRVPSSRPI